MGLVFQWDEKKAASNFGKHAVSFGEAREIFGDPLLLTAADQRSSEAEERSSVLA